MRVVIQRVSEAKVTINQTVFSSIERGLLILLGIEDEDTLMDIEWLVNKIISMRIFNDSEGKMNLSNEDVGGSYLVVSQFTLHESTKKGNRPSFIRAANPQYANDMYESFVNYLRKMTAQQVHTGKFAADMKVLLLNDGPVTILMDSKNKE